MPSEASSSSQYEIAEEVNDLVVDLVTEVEKETATNDRRMRRRLVGLWHARLVAATIDTKMRVLKDYHRATKTVAKIGQLTERRRMRAAAVETIKAHVADHLFMAWGNRLKKRMPIEEDDEQPDFNEAREIARKVRLATERAKKHSAPIDQLRRLALSSSAVAADGEHELPHANRTDRPVNHRLRRRVTPQGDRKVSGTFPTSSRSPTPPASPPPPPGVVRPDGPFWLYHCTHGAIKTQVRAKQPFARTASPLVMGTTPEPVAMADDDEPMEEGVDDSMDTPTPPYRPATPTFDERPATSFQ